MNSQRASTLSNSRRKAQRESGARWCLRSPRALSVISAAAALFLVALAGCGGSSGPAVQTSRATSATTSGIIAIDAKRQRAFVPLFELNDNLHGQIAVLDLSVDPDKQNPVRTIIDIGLIALPRALTVDTKSGTVMALADDVLGTGAIMLINEADDSFTAVPLPTGSRPSETAGVVFDPKNNTALVSMTDSLQECTGESGSCTGMAVFDIAKRTFGPLTVSFIPINSFALNPKADVALGSVDPFAFLLALNLKVSEPIPCELDDENLKNLFKDPDGVAVDPSTDIWVVGNYESTVTSVINLHRSTFEGAGGLDCHLVEGGTPPNSVNHDTGSGAEGMPGVAINSATHQAFMTAQGGNQIALLSLPSSPVKQLTARRIKSVSGKIPNDPQGIEFDSANFPYGTLVDTRHNLGYVVDEDRAFLAEINLSKFKKHPSEIGTPLSAGSCGGVTTSFRCDNGHGVKFFPLPGFAGASLHHLPAILSDQAFLAQKRAKRHK